MTTTTGARPQQIIDVPTVGRRSRVPEGWLRAIVGGVEAAVLSWLTVVVPAIAAYVATATAPALGQASWQSAAATGTALWLLGHGGSVPVGGGAVIGLVPLGLSAVTVALVYGATRRMRLDSLGLAGFAVGGYVLAAAGFSLLAHPAGGAPAAVVGALVLSGLGAGLAVRRAGAPAPGWWLRLRSRLPSSVGAGLRAAGWVGAGLTLLSAVAVGVALVSGWDRVVMIHGSYPLDIVGSVALVLAQLLYLPTASVWALAWVAGPGFAVGAGTHFAAAGVVTAPLPAVPLLGALPAPGTPAVAWAYLLPVAVGLAVGVLVHRWHRHQPFGHAVLAAVLAAVAPAAGAALLAVAAGGSIGPGRMSEIGAAPAELGAVLLAEVGAGLLLVVVALHPSTRALLAHAGRAVRSRAGSAARRGPAGTMGAEISGNATVGPAAGGPPAGASPVAAPAGGTSPSARSTASARTAASGATAASARTASSAVTSTSVPSAPSASTPAAGPSAATEETSLAWLPSRDRRRRWSGPRLKDWAEHDN